MTTQFVRIDLADGAQDFRPIALQPGLAALDRSGANAKNLSRWLGRYASEPVWEDDTVTFHIRDEAGGRLENVYCQPVTSADLDGPLQEEFQSLRERIQSVRPASRDERNSHKILTNPFGPTTAEGKPIDPGGCLFKYRGVQGDWRLVWCWGFQRGEGISGQDVICKSRQCSLLTRRAPSWRQPCPRCGTNLPGGRVPWGRVAAVAALLLLLTGAAVYYLTRPTAILDGRVISFATGEPVADAQVNVEGTKLQAQTDADGKFRIEGLREGSAEIQVIADGYRDEQVGKELVAAEKTTANFALTGAASLTGQVLYAAGSETIPLAETSVHVDGYDKLDAVTDDKGQFAISGILPGEVTVHFEANGCIAQSLHEDLPTGDAEPVRIVLVGSATLTGEVLNAVASPPKPISGAMVRIAGFPKTIQTDADGKFRLPDIRGGKAEIEVTAAGFATTNLSQTLASESETSIRVLLAGGGILAGTVTNAVDRRPVAGARVGVDVAGRELTAMTDAAGRYQIPGIPGGTVTVDVSAAGYGSRQAQKQISQGLATLDFPLTPQAGLSGQVVFSLGGQSRPIAGATVRIVGSQHTGRTDREGQFVIPNIPAGKAVIGVEADGFLPVQGPKELLPDMPPMLITLTGAATLSGTAIDTITRQPIPGASVRLDLEGDQLTAQTDTEGQFRFAPIPARRATVDVAASGYAAGQVVQPLTAGAATVQVALMPQVTISGTVLDAADNRPLADAVVRISGTEQSVRTDVQGRYQLPGVAAGDVSVVASKTGFASSLQQRRVPPGEAIDFRLAQSADLAIEVVNAVNNLPVADAEVVVLVAGEEKRLLTDAAGRVRFTDLAPGAVTATITADEFCEEEIVRQLVVGDATPVRTVMSPKLRRGEVRVVLTWGSYPRDLDCHLFGPPPDDGGKPLHICYDQKAAGNVTLDTDAKKGQGPETITLSQAAPGTYRYMVEDAANAGSPTAATSQAMAQSGALVRVYEANPVPPIQADPQGTGTVWHVCDIEVGRGGKVNVVPVNRFSDQLPRE